jgi:hypothetical protein
MWNIFVNVLYSALCIPLIYFDIVYKCIVVINYVLWTGWWEHVHNGMDSMQEGLYVIF